VGTGTGSIWRPPPPAPEKRARWPGRPGAARGLGAREKEKKVSIEYCLPSPIALTWRGPGAACAPRRRLASGETGRRQSPRRRSPPDWDSGRRRATPSPGATPRGRLKRKRGVMATEAERPRSRESARETRLPWASGEGGNAPGKGGVFSAAGAPRATAPSDGRRFSGSGRGRSERDDPLRKVRQRDPVLSPFSVSARREGTGTGSVCMGGGGGGGGDEAFASGCIKMWLKKASKSILSFASRRSRPWSRLDKAEDVPGGILEIKQGRLSVPSLALSPLLPLTPS